MRQRINLVLTVAASLALLASLICAILMVVASSRHQMLMATIFGSASLLIFTSVLSYGRLVDWRHIDLFVAVFSGFISVTLMFVALIFGIACLVFGFLNLAWAAAVSGAVCVFLVIAAILYYVLSNQ